MGLTLAPLSHQLERGDPVPAGGGPQHLEEVSGPGVTYSEAVPAPHSSHQADPGLPMAGETDLGALASCLVVEVRVWH